MRTYTCTDKALCAIVLTHIRIIMHARAFTLRTCMDRVATHSCMHVYLAHARTHSHSIARGHGHTRAYAHTSRCAHTIVRERTLHNYAQQKQAGMHACMHARTHVHHHAQARTIFAVARAQQLARPSTRAYALIPIKHTYESTRRHTYIRLHSLACVHAYNRTKARTHTNIVIRTNLLTYVHSYTCAHTRVHTNPLLMAIINRLMCIHTARH